MDFTTDNLFPRQKTGRDAEIRTSFRHGKVIERIFDPKKGKCHVRVQYLDREGLISQPIPVKQFGSRATVHCYMPKVGDDVIIEHQPNGYEDGFVSGSFFNTTNPPPDIDIDTRHFKSEDGTIIEYRETDSTFRLDVSGASARTGPKAGGSGGAIIIVGDIQHTGNMITSGVHTDANGIHAGGKERDDLRAEIEALKARVTALEAKVKI